VASHYDGKKFNSPNDIVVSSKGFIYWTDSPGGLVIPGMVGDDLQRLSGHAGRCFVCHQKARSASPLRTAVYPNGLAFTPDEKQLYVNDSRQALIRVFDMRPDGTLRPRPAVPQAGRRRSRRRRRHEG